MKTSPPVVLPQSTLKFVATIDLSSQSDHWFQGDEQMKMTSCFSKDQVYLDGIMRILRHRHTIDFRLLTSLGKVDFEDVERLHPFAQMENTRLPHFMRDMEKYYQHLNHIMEMNQLSDEELCSLLPDLSHSVDIC
ncbi:unnamed protein product [Ranitomeya imitator]|uniref:Uncharacterized protein n=1 Tax=Ranitomeya imitator TaxID=111125 RepID=A0ABN9LV97_9NEOB|nr:unnamed protein product [Ranitomeya imitator]